MPALSERLAKSVKKYDLHLACKTGNNVKQVMTKTKYTVPVANRSKLVYKVKCKNCDCVYIGETKQRLCDRCYRHELNIRNKKTVGSSMLSQHAINENHEFDFSKIKIVQRAPKYHSRKAAEAMHIIKNPTAVNYMKGNAYMVHTKTFSSNIPT